MIIDFHSHVKISKKSTFMPEYFQEMMKEAKLNGLTALALTEHFNTVRFFDIYDYLDQHYSYFAGYYDINGLKLFPGIEVDVAETGHILLIGDRQQIRNISEKLSSHTEETHFIRFDELMDLADEERLLKIGGHPFRESTPLALNVSKAQLKRLDALDLNGKDLYAKGVELCQKELVQLASEIGLPIVGGSDTHQFLQYGSIVNHFEQTCHNSDELKLMIRDGRYQIEIADQLPFKVKAASLVKKYMKKSLNEKETISL